MAPCRLSRLDIQAWERDEGVRLELWERRAILQIDSLQLEIVTTTKT